MCLVGEITMYTKESQGIFGLLDFSEQKLLKNMKKYKAFSREIFIWLSNLDSKIKATEKSEKVQKLLNNS